MKHGKIFMLAALMGLVFTACRKKDAVDPDVLVNFEATAQGLSAAEDSLFIKVKLTSAASTNIPIVLNVTDQGVAYGTDYTTEPAAAGGKITLTVPTGNNEASFKIKKVANALFDGDEKIVFDIYSSGIPVIIGATKQLTLSFAELLSTSAAATIQGGGANYPNKVFIDLSANRQSGADRSTWDLGFYCGSDDYRVILNSSINMMVKQINKSDLTAVTVADTVGITADLGFSQTTLSSAQLPYIDYPTGDLTKTAIAAVSATATENKVYIVNRGNGIGAGAPSRGWKKIRIIRNAAGGYTLQHANIESATFTSVDIAKDDTYHFKYASFETGAINIEPQKARWDFAWTYFANTVVFPGYGEVPYLYQDVIIINRGVSIAKVMTATKAYDDFTMADVAAQTFLTTQNAYASDWRSGGGPSTAPAVRTDRYYIIKDPAGNYYKLKFTALTLNGERGYPAYQADKL